jgi:DNA replication protein DnaC
MSRAILVADVIRTQARQLKMPALARSFEELARQARVEHWPHEDYLHEALAVEIASRAESAVKQRLRAAAFPELRTLDEFDFSAADGVSAAQIAELARGDWIARGENVLFAGPIGTGKTHLAIALGVEAARQRRRVVFWRAADLVRTLVEARDQKELSRYMRRLERIDLLLLDEVGFVPFDRAGGELLSTCLRLGTDGAACSSQPISRLPSGRASSAATRSSRRRCSIVSPSRPPRSRRRARATACASAHRRRSRRPTLLRLPRPTTLQPLAPKKIAKGKIGDH